MVFELWRAESEHSYALRYFPDISDYSGRPQDEQIVWTVNADSYEEARHARNTFLGWPTETLTVGTWDYPPIKHTFLGARADEVSHWAFVDARSADQIRREFPGLEVISTRPTWLTPELQRRFADRSHYDIDKPSDWLERFGMKNGPAV